MIVLSFRIPVTWSDGVYTFKSSKYLKKRFKSISNTCNTILHFPKKKLYTSVNIINFVQVLHILVRVFQAHYGINYNIYGSLDSWGTKYIMKKTIEKK